MTRTSVTIHLPDDLLATIKSLAEQEERSRNQVICRLLDEALTLPRVVNGQGELRGFVATTPAITVSGPTTQGARPGTERTDHLRPDLSIPAPTGDVMKDVPLAQAAAGRLAETFGSLVEVPPEDFVADRTPKDVRTVRGRVVTTDRPEFRGPIPKGGKK